MANYLRETTRDDIEYVVPRLRKADYDECLAATGKEPLEALLYSYSLEGRHYTLVSPSGEPVGLCGVVKSNIEGAGVVWMVATTAIMKHQMTFLRNSKEALGMLSEGYDVLFNCVDARNTVHMKWLKWMGFTFINKHENYGAEGRPFYEFVRITHV